MDNKEIKVYTEIYSLPDSLTVKELINEGIDRTKKKYPELSGLDESKFDWLVGHDGDDMLNGQISVRIQICL